MCGWANDFFFVGDGGWKPQRDLNPCCVGGVGFHVVGDHLGATFLLLGCTMQGCSSETNTPAKRAPTRTPRSVRMSTSVSGLPSPSRVTLAKRSTTRTPRRVRSSRVLCTVPERLPSLLPGTVFRLSLVLWRVVLFFRRGGTIDVHWFF